MDEDVICGMKGVTNAGLVSRNGYCVAALQRASREWCFTLSDVSAMSHFEGSSVELVSRGIPSS